jgi:hypothetical protein
LILEAITKIVFMLNGKESHLAEVTFSLAIRVFADRQYFFSRNPSLFIPWFQFPDQKLVLLLDNFFHDSARLLDIKSCEKKLKVIVPQKTSTLQRAFMLTEGMNQSRMPKVDKESVCIGVFLKKLLCIESICPIVVAIGNASIIEAARAIAQENSFCDGSAIKSFSQDFSNYAAGEVVAWALARKMV